MTIAHIEVRVFRAPTPAPVATSFGVMRDRPAVFVRLTARDGAFGWGEIFANWPSAGAEHRARLLIEDMADLILGAETKEAEALGRDLTARTRVRALQCGEPGPFAQVIAGLDTAALAAARSEARWGPEQGAIATINHPTLDLGSFCIGCAWQQPVAPPACSSVTRPSASPPT